MESNDLKMPGVGALMSKASRSAIQTTSSPAKQPPTANAIESRSHVSGPFGNIGSSTRKHKSGKRDRPEKNTIHEIRHESTRSCLILARLPSCRLVDRLASTIQVGPLAGLNEVSPIERVQLSIAF